MSSDIQLKADTVDIEKNLSLLEFSTHLFNGSVGILEIKLITDIFRLRFI